MRLQDRKTSIYAVVAVILSLALGLLVARSAGGGWPFIATASSIVALLGAVLFLGHPGAEGTLRHWAGISPARGAWLAIGVVAVPYALYLAASGGSAFTVVGSVKLATCFVVPALLMIPRPITAQPLVWRDVAALLLLWIPFDHRWLGDVWQDPRGFTYVSSSLLVVTQSVIVFGLIRRLDGIGFRLIPTRRDVVIGLFFLSGFFIIALPIGLATDFLHFQVKGLANGMILLSFLGIFLTIAAPEELIFRGLILNLLSKSSLPRGVPLAISSILFGLIHWNNGQHWDWRYLALATIAGAFYGGAYLRAGGLFAAMLTHTLVDVIWKHFLGG